MKYLLPILALTACHPRHPERDACYIQADATAAREYMTECADYPDTRVCPAGDAIESRHEKAQEACK
jgi:hypothetical protein